MSTKAKKAATKAPKTDSHGAPDTGVGQSAEAGNKSKSKDKAKAKAKDKDEAQSPEEKPRTGNHPKNKNVPESVLSAPTPSDDAPGMNITPVAKVKGDSKLIIIDLINNGPVRVALIDGKPVTPDTDGRVVFVESNVIHDVMTVDAARNKFAIREDGTVFYAQRGFDATGPQPGQQKIQMVDIVKLIEHNN